MLISFQSSITKQIPFCGDSLIENSKPVPILDFEQFLIILPARQKSMIFFYKTTTNLSRIHAIIAKQKKTLASFLPYCICNKHFLHAAYLYYIMLQKTKKNNLENIFKQSIKPKTEKYINSDQTFEITFTDIFLS